MSMVLMAMVAAVAAQAPGIMSNPGGAIPAGVQMPSIAGFNNPTIQPSRGGLAICVSGDVPVTASSTNMKFNLPSPPNQTVVTDSFVQMVTSGSTIMQQLMAGTQNASGTYNISSTLCVPANGTSSNTVQFLTHGIGFDKYYWDFAPGYSYVDYAVQQGYATFSYDRLGVGRSSTPDGINIVQSPFEVAIAVELIRMLRSATFSGQNFSHVVGTGHSFGSIITQAITAKYPSLLDAAILTGFSMNSSGMPAFLLANNFAIASQNSPYRFSGYNNSYLITASNIANQIAFFRAPTFDPAILSLATATAGTVTLGELLTTQAVVAPAMNFTGPVAVVNGANDLPFCTGNCSYPTNLAAAARSALYPQASNSTTSTYFAPETGHGVNLHYSALGAYQFIQNFIKNAGL